MATKKLTAPEQVAAELYKRYGSKSEVARDLLHQGWTVSEISKAVPMAYSQVHAINQKRAPVSKVKVVQYAGKNGKILAVDLSKAKPERMAETVVRLATDDPRFKTVQQRNADRRRLAETQKLLKSGGKLNPKTGRLRTPGLPSDHAAGACANCGNDVVVRSLATGYTLVHVGISAEDFLGTVQFCQAVPQSLVGR